MREILSCIPKQRRTGLFSATQVKEEDDLMVFGLRNAKQVKVSQERNSAAPSTLKNYFTECPADEKTSVCLEFIRQRVDKKFLIFFPSCNSVRYFQKVNLVALACLKPIFCRFSRDVSRRDRYLPFMENALILTEHRKSKHSPKAPTELWSRLTWWPEELISLISIGLFNTISQNIPGRIVVLNSFDLYVSAGLFTVPEELRDADAMETRWFWLLLNNSPTWNF